MSPALNYLGYAFTETYCFSVNMQAVKYCMLHVWRWVSFKISKDQSNRLLCHLTAQGSVVQFRALEYTSLILSILRNNLIGGLMLWNCYHWRWNPSIVPCGSRIPGFWFNHDPDPDLSALWGWINNWMDEWIHEDCIHTRAAPPFGYKIFL